MKRIHTRILGVLFLVLVSNLLSINQAIATIPGNERAVLIALYNSTNGDNWTNKSGWKTPPLDTDGFAMPGTENVWYGISCDEGNTTVREIDLYDNNLTGSIPTELGNLTNLKNIYLNDNKFTGSIPSSLSNLTNLKVLILSHNQLTGSIPNVLGNLINLQRLILASNQLTGPIPPELGNLTNLQELRLYLNQLTGPIPPELGSMTNLRKLLLDCNQLTGDIPITLRDLSSLSELDISYNALHTNDKRLLRFFNSKDLSCRISPQTLAPEKVTIGPIADTSVVIQWTPIAYTDHFGDKIHCSYMIYYGTTPGGPYILFDTAEDEATTLMEVTGLKQDTSYYFTIQTRTGPHGWNPNTVYSDYSEEVSVTTDKVY